MDSGSLVWVLVSAAMVLFMTPGLAFFYGGMDRTRNVLNMLMMNFYCLLIIPPLWVLLAYTLSQGGSGNWIGNFEWLGLRNASILEDSGGGAGGNWFLAGLARIPTAAN